MLLAFGFYFGIALVITWPLATILGTHFLGHPFGDTYEYVRHIWWFKHAIQTGQPLFEQPLLGYPNGLNGAWLWAIPLQSFPASLFAFVMPLPAAFNITLLLRLALNGWSMFVLVRHLTSNRNGPALLAGVVFMAYPTFQGQLAAGHIGLLVLWPVPLFIYAVLRLQNNAQSGGLITRWILLTALLFSLSLWGSFTLLIFIVGPVTLLLLGQQINSRQWRALGYTIIALLLGGLLELIFIGPFLLEQLHNPTLAAAGNAVEFSADLLTIVTPSFHHPVFSNLDYTHQLLGIEPFERMGYVGIVALLLALIGVWRSGESRRWLGLAVIAWILALGPLLKILNDVAAFNLGNVRTFVTMPWAVLAMLPILNMTRTPARFYFTIALAVAIMVGYGATFVWDRLHRLRWPVMGLLIVFIIADYQAFWPLPTLPGILPEPIHALAEREDIRAVMDVPWAHPLAQKDGMFLQTAHQQPLIAGHIARRTPVDPARLTVLQATFDPALLDREQVDIVMWHKRWVAPDAQPPWDPPIYEDQNIAVYEVPTVTNEPTFQTVPNNDSLISDENPKYFFAPEPGWASLNGELQADGRNIHLLLDDQVIQRWAGAETVAIDLPIPILNAGYHTLTLALDPPCPAHYATGLRCQSVTIRNLALAEFTADTFVAPIQFEQGVSLRSQRLDAEDHRISVQLLWTFAEPRTDNDIRFVHVVDENGDLVAQNDQTLGAQSAGSAWVEEVVLEDLPAGTYTVYTGWYTYPDLIPLAILFDVPDAANNRVLLGTVVVEG